MREPHQARLIGVYGCLLLVTGFSVRYLYFTLTGFAVLLAVVLFRTCASVAKRQNGYPRLVALVVIIAVLNWNAGLEQEAATALEDERRSRKDHSWPT